MAAACASKSVPAARLVVTSVIEFMYTYTYYRCSTRRVFVSPRSGVCVDRLLRKFAVCCSGRVDHDQWRSARRHDRSLHPRACAPIEGVLDATPPEDTLYIRRSRVHYTRGNTSGNTAVHNT